MPVFRIQFTLEKITLRRTDNGPLTTDRAPLTMRVHQATSADLDQVIEFNRLLAVESEGKALDLAKLRPGVAAALADEHKGLYFLAEANGQALGQMGGTCE